MTSKLLTLATITVLAIAATACGSSADANSSRSNESLPPVVQKGDSGQGEPTIVPGGANGTVTAGRSNNDGDTPNEAPADNDTPVDLAGAAAALEGLELLDANTWATDHSMIVRVVEQDGEVLMVTMDFSESRINVMVTDQIITKVVSLG